MVTQNAIFKSALVFFFISLATMAKTVFSQDCERIGCPGLNECCNGFTGLCGTKDEQCGFWCSSGSCNLTGKVYGFDYNVSDGPRAKIESIVTPVLFDRIMYKKGKNCPDKGFYSHQAFIAAVKSFEAYKGTVAKREVAAILSHFSQGSTKFCYKEETTKEKYCSESKNYPCEPGKSYYGRGPLQAIRWNEYYGAAGKFLGLPLLKDPDMVARDPEVAFKFAMWYWNKYVRPALYLGFGETARRVDHQLCYNMPGHGRAGIMKLGRLYAKLCRIFGVTPDQALGPYC